MKRALLGLAICLGLPGIVVAAVAYSANITVSNNSTAAYPSLGVIHSTNITMLVDLNYISASGLDVAITSSGNPLPYMLADDKLLFAPAVPANSSNTFQFQTGQTPDTAFDIITGCCGYVTTPDNASLEIASNGTLSLKAYLADDASLVSKQSAFDISYDDATDNVTAFVLTETAVAQDAQSSYFSLFAPSRLRFGQRINSFPIGSVDAVQFYVLKGGSPTGTGYVRVRKVSDDSLIGTLGSIDVSTLTGAYAWYTFNAPVTISTSEDVRILFEYAGGDGSNYVNVGFDGADTIAGMATYYNTGWTDYAGFDATIRYNYTTLYANLTATGVTGLTTVQVSNNATSAQTELWIDGTLEDSAALVAIPNSANNTVWFSALNTYAEYAQIVVGGNQRLYYAPDSIIQGTVLPDRSGNSNNGAFTWGSNPAGVSLSMGGLVPPASVSGAGSSTSYTGSFISDNLTNITSPTLSAAQTAAQTLPLNAFLQPFADVISLPVIFFYWFGTIILALAAFILTYRTKHLLLSAVAWDVIFGFGIAVGFIPWWVLILLVLWTVGSVIMETRMG